MQNNTDILGLVGYPLGHSLSPLIHNSIYKNYGINSVYTLFETLPYELHSTVESIRSLSIKGVNVTIPFKESIIEYLDELDNSSSSIGAVNTIINENGVLKGYNTDYYGFSKSLELQHVNTSGRNVFIIGSGGAAKSAAFSLLKNGSRVYIFNRSIEKAEKLCSNYSLFQDNITPCELAYIDESIIRIKPYMIVNCTPVGMKGYGGSLNIKSSSIKGNVEVLYDLVYNPHITSFLSLGEACGCRSVSGIDMLLLQAFASIKIWTGKEIDLIIGKNILQQEGIFNNM